MRALFLSVFVALGACRPTDAPIDLTERLGPDQARAGVISDEASLFGGISAEGRTGDVLIYNDRARFVIQGVREGSYYVTGGGVVIDADIVRGAGEPGRDAVDEWAGMYGLGRILDVSTVTVVDDGLESGVARVVVEGEDTALGVLVGILESPGLVPIIGLGVRVEYTLPAGSPLLEVRTTLTAPSDRDITIPFGDLLFGSAEALQAWHPEGGFDGARNAPPWSGYVSRRDDLAYAVLSTGDETFDRGGIGLIGDLIDMVGGFGAAVPIAAGESASTTRYYGVGRDLATLTDAWLRAEGVSATLVEGQVTAPDGPVAGARVTIRVDGAPYTLALTDAEGRFTASVPAGAQADAIAAGEDGRLFTGVPSPTRWSPYASAQVRAAALAALADAADTGDPVTGRGWGTADAPLTLLQSGRLVVRSADGLPFEVRVHREDPPASPDARLVPGGGADGAWAIGWGRDGTVAMDLQPGSYTLRAHRGIRFERDEAAVTVTAGGEHEVEVALPAAYAHPGWLLGDPHQHGSPSSDGAITMEDRLIVAAGVGLQLHFGTDHDHVADYRPLLAPLGLADVLQSVVADEVSPELRGHHNIYPLEEVPGEPNNGALLWWAAGLADTLGLHTALRERHGDILIQANHPMDSGIASAAQWAPGRIGKADRWSDDFDALEVMNGGTADGLDLFLDLITRGVHTAPVGVSDSHGHTSGHIGASATFFGVGTDDPTALTLDALREAVRAGRTIVSRGPFLELSLDPGSTSTDQATLEVVARHPTWMQIDRIKLLRDGEEVEVVEGAEATFTLAPEADAAYFVIVEGDAPMTPIYSRTPWALAGPFRVDVGGNGWTPPLPALNVE